MNKEISNILNLEFDKKNTVFFYNKHTHFRQNRIAQVGEGTLGFSDKFKNRLVIPYMSSPRELKHLIAHEFTHIAQFEVLYGGFWRSGRLIKGLSGLEPMWIMEGMSETISHDILNEEWTSYDRMVLRDAAIYERLYSFRELQNFSPLYRDVYLGYKQGHSAMDYLVEKEGRQIHRRLLNSIRNNLDPLKAFEMAVTQFSGLKDFNTRWQEWLGEKVDETVKGKKRAEKTYPALVKDKYNSRNPVYAADGSFYYVSDRWGKDEIYFHSQGENKKILPNFFVSGADNLITGDRVYDRIIDYCPRSNILVFAARKNQRAYLYIYNSKSGELKKFRPQLDEIRSPALSPGGKLIAFTGREGFNRNIYIYNIDTEKLTALTGDRYPDYAPTFSPGGDKIIAASERNYKKDLREIDIQSGKVKWLSNTACNEFHPAYLKDGNIIYISDKNKINNLYLLDTSSSQSHSLTDIESGVFYPHSAAADKIISSLYYDGSNKIAYIPLNTAGADSTDESPQEQIYTEVVISTADIKTEDARGRFSTDFFFPSFMYATDIGFIGGGMLRMSDYFAHNIIEAYGWAWPGSYEASLQYVNKSFRSDIFTSVATEGRDFKKINDDDIYRRRQYSAVAGYTYPLTKYTAFTHYAQASSREDENLDEGEISNYYTNTGSGVVVERNTTIMEPFQALRGYRLSLGAYLARPLEKDGLDYNRYSLSARKYTPLSRNIIMAKKADFARDERRDASDFKLGGSSLRGYSRGSFEGNNVAVFSAEARAMLFPRLNWHISFIWPDINIYSISARIFSDAGSAFGDNSLPETAGDWGASWGFGLKLNFYFLQLSPGFLSVDFATPYEDSEGWKTYWKFTAGHIRW